MHNAFFLPFSPSAGYEQYRIIGYGIICYHPTGPKFLRDSDHCIYIPARIRNLSCKSNFLYTPVGLSGSVSRLKLTVQSKILIPVP
jgi:hypothetical protein